MGQLLTLGSVRTAVPPDDSGLVAEALLTAAPKIVADGVGKVFMIRPARKGGSLFRNGTPSEVVALRDVDLEVRQGEFLVIVGPSGCGKSSFLDIIAGLSKPSEGTVSIDDTLVTGPGLDRAVVFQQYALFPWRTALGNVSFGLENLKVPRAERHERALEFLSRVGLAGFERHYPYQLSGGMRQRAAIARALAYDPSILLMDEPFGALDNQTRELLQGELVRIWTETAKTIVFITHSIEEAVFLGDRVAIMTARPGRIKQVVEVPLSRSEREEDAEIRSSREFIAIRREISALLHDEVGKSQQAAAGWSDAPG